MTLMNTDDLAEARKWVKMGYQGVERSISGDSALKGVLAFRCKARLG